ncbi:putative rRNA maturation factor [Microbacteriaceae bacterium MWH-Ta3]|nr:putative rRNA maturation factor [Microbacteriaceae bacterium MWH-Ta3]
MSIDIVNETEFVIDDAMIARLVSHNLQGMRVHVDADISVMFVDETAMERLHVEWMDEPGPTDVLSFPMDELRPGTEDKPTEPGLLGDVVVCPTVAARQAVIAGHSTEDEIRLLITHGMLHLLGFDHAEPDEEREMFGIQKELLLSFAKADRGN